MPEVPDAAVQAAAVALQAIIDPAGLREMDVYRAHARAVLEAAAPALAAAVAEKITAHMDAHGPREGAASGLVLSWRRHFRIAAQVAAGAFSTREDQLREAAQAIADGNYMGCNLGEDDLLWDGQARRRSSTR